jgi:hypothetical protein
VRAPGRKNIRNTLRVEDSESWVWDKREKVSLPYRWKPALAFHRNIRVTVRVGCSTICGVAGTLQNHLHRA